MAFQTADSKTGKTFINLWDIPTGRLIGRNIEGSSLNFSPDSQTLIYQTTNQDTGQTHFNLWDIATAREIGEDIEGSYVTLNSESQTLIYQTIDSETGEVSINLLDITGAVEPQTVNSNQFVASQDGQILTYITIDAESGNSTINLLDITTGTPFQEPIMGGLWAQSTNGKIWLYFSSDENGQSTNVLNTVTGDVFSIDNSNFYSTNEIKDIFAYEIYDYDEAGGCLATAGLSPRTRLRGN